MGMCSPWLELPASLRDHAEGPAGSLEGNSWFHVVSHHIKFILYEYITLPASWRDHAEGPAGSLEGTSWFHVVSHHIKFILYEYISLPDFPSPRGTSASPSSCILLLLAE